MQDKYRMNPPVCFLSGLVWMHEGLEYETLEVLNGMMMDYPRLALMMDSPMSLVMHMLC